ncbi:gfo/Idh/MocA family oxidoreductase [bacterium]|nr:MAG: gfo/Idh/MocA family oxidoreductase [bacterium]
MVNCTLIGCGYWGSILRRYLEGNPNINLVHVCNSKADLNEIWSDKQIPAVVVATPNDTHYPIVKAALLSGKNVLSEKPLALKTEQCEELKQIAQDNKLVLLVNYTYTFSRMLKLAQDMVRKGEIGNILGIEMSVRHLGRFGGGSVYWLLGSHMLSVLDMFVPLRETTFLRKDLVTYTGTVETGVISFRNGDISGQIVISLNYPGKETKIILYGENGTIIYDPEVASPLQIDKYQRIRWTIASKLPKEHREFPHDESNNLRFTVEHFVESIAGRGESNIDRAVNVTRIIETLQQQE